MLCPWLWKVLQLPNIGIHFDTPPYMEVVIGLEFTYLKKEIMYTCSKQHQLLCIWLHDALFHICKRVYLLVCCCWKAKMVKHGRIMCVIVHCVTFPMWMAKLTHLWKLFMLNFIVCCVGMLYYSCWCVINVQGVGIWDASHHLWTRY
jgi:hypothetical protein